MMQKKFKQFCFFIIFIIIYIYFSVSSESEDHKSGFGIKLPVIEVDKDSFRITD